MFDQTIETVIERGLPPPHTLLNVSYYRPANIFQGPYHYATRGWRATRRAQLYPVDDLEHPWTVRCVYSMASCMLTHRSEFLLIPSGYCSLSWPICCHIHLALDAALWISRGYDQKRKSLADVFINKIHVSWHSGLKTPHISVFNICYVWQNSKNICVLKHMKQTKKILSTKPGPLSRAHCGTVCALLMPNSTLLNWSIVSLLILFYSKLFSNVFCILVHDYTLCFTGSSCCSVVTTVTSLYDLTI